MTDFAVQCVTTPMLSPFVSSDKGDIASRLQCSAEQTKNAAATLVKGGTVAGGAGLLLYLGKKCPKVAEVLGKGLDKVLDLLPNGKIVGTLKVASIFASPKAKITALVLPPAVALVSCIVGNGIYKSGQIDQKYTDAAKVEARQKGYLL